MSKTKSAQALARKPADKADKRGYKNQAKSSPAAKAAEPTTTKRPAAKATAPKQSLAVIASSANPTPTGSPVSDGTEAIEKREQNNSAKSPAKAEVHAAVGDETPPAPKSKTRESSAVDKATAAPIKAIEKNQQSSNGKGKTIVSQAHHLTVNASKDAVNSRVVKTGKALNAASCGLTINTALERIEDQETIAHKLQFWRTSFDQLSIEHTPGAGNVVPDVMSGLRPATPSPAAKAA